MFFYNEQKRGLKEQNIVHLKNVHKNKKMFTRTKTCPCPKKEQFAEKNEQIAEKNEQFAEKNEQKKRDETLDSEKKNM